MNDTEQQAVLDTILSMTRAFHAGDLEGVMRSYEPDPHVVFEPQAPAIGDAAVRAAFREAFGLEPQFEYAGHDVRIAGDLALHIAPWTMRATTPDGSQVEQQGLSVAVLRRQPDGAWRMAIDHPHGQHLM